MNKAKSIVLINNATHQRETLSERPIRLTLINQAYYIIQKRSTGLRNVEFPHNQVPFTTRFTPHLDLHRMLFHMYSTKSGM